MANKKLKVEVELETAKAKRQAKELEQSGGASAGGAGGVASASDKAAKALERAAKGSNEFADAAGKMSGQTRALIRGFAGMGVGMAMSYASNYMPQGKAREGVEAAGSAITGASAALNIAQYLPGGNYLKLLATGVGAAGGYLTKKADQNKRYDDYTAEWVKSEENYKEANEFADLVRSLTTVTDGFTDFKGRLKEINAELEKRKKAEQDLIDKIDKAREDHKYDQADLYRGDLARNRQQQDSLKNAARTIEALDKEKKPVNDRPGFSAPDTLSRIGGAFAGQRNSQLDGKADLDFIKNRKRQNSLNSEPIAESLTLLAGAFDTKKSDPEMKTQTSTMKEQLEVLKRIEQKSGGKF